MQVCQLWTLCFKNMKAEMFDSRQLQFHESKYHNHHLVSSTQARVNSQSWQIHNKAGGYSNLLSQSKMCFHWIPWELNGWNTAGLIFGVDCLESCKLLVLSPLLNLDQTTVATRLVRISGAFFLTEMSWICEATRKYVGMNSWFVFTSLIW